MVLIVIAVLAVIFEAARRGGWPPAVLGAAAWTRVRPRGVAYIGASPATFAYLAVLTVTT